MDESVFRKKFLNETDNGRLSSWWVHKADSIIAMLDDGKFDDMFWYSYRINAVEGGPPLDELLKPELWQDFLVYVNCTLNEPASNAFCAICGPNASTGRIRVRALYL